MLSRVLLLALLVSSCRGSEEEQTRPVDPATTPIGEFWVLDQPPEGFTLVGRYAVVPPQPENFTDPLREGFRRAGVVDAFRSGPDLFVIERGATLRAQPPWEPDPTRDDVTIASLGRLLTIGVALVLVCYLVVLPAVLEWDDRRRKARRG